MLKSKIIITKDGMEYGEDLKTLEELLPIMCVSVAYACRALGKNPINALIAVSGVLEQAKTPEEFGHIKEIKQTNADWIRNMSNEELAEFLLKVNTAYAEPCMTGEKDCKWEDYPTHDKGCNDCFKEWLESERDTE